MCVGYSNLELKGEEGNWVGRARERNLKEKQGNEREGIYERGKS